MELLDESKDYFVRYGGHRQAAGFTIAKELFPKFEEHITRKFYLKYGDVSSLPPKSLIVECEIFPGEVNFDTFSEIESFRPFGIGNPKPKFYIDGLSVTEVKTL